MVTFSPAEIVAVRFVAGPALLAPVHCDSVPWKAYLNAGPQSNSWGTSKPPGTEGFGVGWLAFRPGVSFAAPSRAQPPKFCAAPADAGTRAATTLPSSRIFFTWFL